jgi:DNA repair exonuclease SbcCD ATPase subunit
LAELDEELAHSDHHIDSLEARLHLLEQEKADLQLQVKDLTDVVDAASLASQLAAEQRQELVGQYSKQILDLEAKSAQTLSELESRLQDSESRNKILLIENEKRQAETDGTLTEIETQNAQLNEEKQRLLESLDECHAENEELELQINELRGSYEMMKGSESEVQQLLQIAKDRVIQAELTTRQTQEAYQRATQEIKELEEQIERIKWRSKEEIDEWSAKISQLERDLESSQAEALLTKQTLLEEHQLLSQSSHEQSETEIKNLRDLLAKKEQQNQTLSSEFEMKQQETLLLLQEQTTMCEAMKDQLQGKQEELANLQSSTVPSLQQELTDLRLANDSLKLALQNLESDVVSEQKRHEHTLERNSQMEKELTALTQRNLELEDLLASLPPPSSPPPPVEDPISLARLNQSLEYALQDLRNEREKSDCYRTKRDEEVLGLHKQMISLQEQLQTIQNHNREMADTVELERKNRTALLNESKNELQETKNQLLELTKKLSKSERGGRSRSGSRSGSGSGTLSRHQSRRSMSRLMSGAGDYEDEYDTDEDETSHALADRALMVKHHRDLAVARAEIADLAHQLVESAHREDELQQCVTDLQQEISLIMGHMNELQTQLQFQSQVQSLRQTNSHLLLSPSSGSEQQQQQYRSHDDHRSSSLSSSSSTKLISNLLPNYDLIEKYKQLYAETLERCHTLEEEILHEKGITNERTNELTGSLHEEINQLQEQNMKLAKELYEMKQIYKEAVSSLKKRTKEDANNSTELVEKYQRLHDVAIERCQSLEEDLLREREEKNEVISQLSNELSEVKEENKTFEKMLSEAVKEKESWKAKEGERSREVMEAQQQLKTMRSAFQDLAMPLNRLLSQDERS